METATVRTHPKSRAAWLVPGILLVLAAVVVGLALAGSGTGGNVLTTTLTQPIDNAKSASVLIDPGDGNLSIGTLPGGDAALARGTLEYRENKGLPISEQSASNGQARLTLKAASGQPWLNVPWAACNGATSWQVQLNPALPLDITAQSAGGNMKIDLAGMTVTRLAAETGGGNADVVLPDRAADLSAVVKTGGGDVQVTIGREISGSHSLTAGSGAGNVTVRLPAGTAARIHASSGVGKVSVDGQFSPAGKDTYQSANYDSAAQKIEITLTTGAGNVTVSTY